MINLNPDLLNQFNLTALSSPHLDVDLYACPLSQATLLDKHVIFLQTLLTSAEQEKTLSYQTDKLKANAILSRGLLRLILAQYIKNIHPRDINLQYHTYGKPYLHDDLVHFSVSHCDSLLVIAVSHRHVIGIDIERLNTIYQDDLSAFVLSHKESSVHQQLKKIAQEAYFLHCWTRKEAYLKAIGTGLVNHLNLIDTSEEYIIDQGKQTTYLATSIEVDQQHIASLVILSDPTSK